MPGVVTWLGHSTVLLELGGARLITDPLLRPRVAHLLRRVAEPGDARPPRRDPHLARAPRPPRPGVAAAARPGRPGGGAARRGALAARARGRAVHTLSPGETVELAGVRVAAVPAVHDGRRIPLGRPSSAVGFVVDRVYFAGDTEPYPEMASLAGSLDAALLPVAGWGPKTGPGHMDAREAAEALALLQPALAVPIHWGTYRRVGHTPQGDPAREFAEHAAELAPSVRIARLEPGGSVEITRAV